MRQYIPAIRTVQLLLDVLAVQACLYFLAMSPGFGGPPLRFGSLVAISSLLMIVIYQWSGVYSVFRAGGFWADTRALLRAWVYLLLVLLLAGTAARVDGLYSRELLLGWAISGALAQLLMHWTVALVVRRLRSRGINQRRTLLVGVWALARAFAENLQRDDELGIRVLGFVTTDAEDEKPGAGELACLGSVQQLPQVVEAHQVDLVYLTLPIDQSARIGPVMEQLMPLHVDVHWVPDMSMVELLNHRVYDVSGQPVHSLSDSPHSGLRRIGKRLEDLALASVILLTASPLMLLVAASVKLTSPGPVLFRQVRIGRDGERFVTYKFRTMVAHEEEPGQVTQAVQGDPRITAIGALLRRTSLDELPQLFNVLQGQMSIVGPRPHAAEHDSYYAQHVRAYMLRHRVKPGITGWAQVNGWRGETDTQNKMKMRVQHDLYYINHWSLEFDLIIIARTIWQLLFGRNAY